MSKNNGFVFPSSVTISNCSKLYKELSEVMANNSNIELDASQIDEIDTAGIQLITSFCISVRKNDSVSACVKSSSDLKEVFSALGLEGVLTMQ